MSIQWFPGHMNAARKKAAESMEKTDLVIEVVDARLPQASCNPMIDELRRSGCSIPLLAVGASLPDRGLLRPGVSLVPLIEGARRFLKRSRVVVSLVLRDTRPVERFGLGPVFCWCEARIDCYFGSP